MGSAQSRGAEGSPRGGCSSSLGVDGQCRALLCVAATEPEGMAWGCVRGGVDGGQEEILPHRKVGTAQLRGSGHDLLAS